MEAGHHAEDDYFLLIERVNSKGKYQRNIFLLFYANWFVTAFTVLQVAFLLLPRPLACPLTPDPALCRAAVCALPPAQWRQFEKPSPIVSLADELGSYHCQDEANISNYKMTLFMGILAGYLVFTHCADNFGRRLAVLLTWTTAAVGLALLWASPNIELACVGLFLAGAGCESNIRVTLAVLSETVDYHLRQTYSLILQTAYGLAGICVSVGYYYLQNWRVVNFIFCALPALLLLVALAAYLEETPRHLARKSSRALLDSLRRIASINGLECQIGEAEVIAVMNQREESKVESGLSLLDLLRFPSLRRNTIYLSVVLFFLASLYFGPSSVIDQFEVDIFLLQIILSLSDCIAYPIACHFISTTHRRRAAIKYFALCATFTLAAHFFSPTDGCTSCLPAIIRIVFLFLSRYCVSYYYGVVFLYIVEIYPEQIRNIGFGAVSAAGALGSILVQKVLAMVETNGHDPLLYMCGFSIVCLLASTRLPETHGLPLQLQIEELKKKRMKQRYEPSLQESYEDLEFSSSMESSRTVEPIPESPSKSIP